MQPTFPVRVHLLQWPAMKAVRRAHRLLRRPVLAVAAQLAHRLLRRPLHAAAVGHALRLLRRPLHAAAPRHALRQRRQAAVRHALRQHRRPIHAAAVRHALRQHRRLLHAAAPRHAHKQHRPAALAPAALHLMLEAAVAPGHSRRQPEAAIPRLRGTTQAAEALLLQEEVQEGSLLTNTPQQTSRFTPPYGNETGRFCLSGCWIPIDVPALLHYNHRHPIRFGYTLRQTPIWDSG